MAQLQDETVQKLNALLEKLAKDKADRGPSLTGPGGESVGDPAAAKAYAKEIKDLSAAIAEAETQYSKFFDSVERSSKLETLNLQKDLAGLRQQLAGLEEGSDEIAGLTGQIGELEGQLQALGAEGTATEYLSRVGSDMMGLSTQTGGVSEKLINLGKNFKGVGALGGSFSKVLSKGFKGIGLNLLASGISKLIGQTVALVKAQDEAISSFRKATGASAEYNYEITQTERRNFAAGVSAADAGRAFEGLFTNFSAFTQLNQSERAGLIDTTVNLEKLGVSAQTTGKIFDQAMRGSGMSASQANDLVLDLAGSAKSLGVPMSKMANDFAGSFGELSKYGDGAIKVFKGLAVQAKNTGLEVNQLLNITKQFDTFEGAAMSVGKLNAILGGPYLNSIDMLNATEEERIEILRRQVDMAGVQFDALNRFEQQAISSALNMSVEEANRLFRMSKEEHELEAMRQEELQKQAETVQTMTAQLKSALMALAVDLRPVVEGVILPMIQGFAKLMKFIGGAINKLGTFAKVAMLAAGIAALIGAPFTGGASLVTYAAIAGTAGFATMGAGGNDAAAPITPRFQQGGTISTGEAIVHPGEMVITGGQGSQVVSQADFKELIDGIKKLTAAGSSTNPIQLAVYIGQDKIDEVVVKAIGSEAGRRVLSPYSMV
jgi:hypothetical protein